MKKRKEKNNFEEKENMKRLFFTLLDSVILLSFGLSLYFILIGDFIKTILFLAVGTLLLMFFIVRGILSTTKIKF